MNKNQPYSERSVIKKIQKEIGDSVSVKDVTFIINTFWTIIKKHTDGYESFSVKKMFFFKVHKNKLSLALDKKRKSHNKKMRKYRRKLTRIRQREKRKKMFK